MHDKLVSLGSLEIAVKIGMVMVNEWCEDIVSTSVIITASAY